MWALVKIWTEALILFYSGITKMESIGQQVNWEAVCRKRWQIGVGNLVLSFSYFHFSHVVLTSVFVRTNLGTAYIDFHRHGSEEICRWSRTEA